MFGVTKIKEQFNQLQIHLIVENTTLSLMNRIFFINFD